LEDRIAGAEDHAVPPSREVEILSQSWLHDQSIAFAATLLGKVDISLEARALAAAEFIVASIDRFSNGMVSDSTLALVTTVDEDYRDAEKLNTWGFERLPGCAAALDQAIKVAQAELARRDAIAASSLNRMLISHAVYLLKRPHLPAVRFLKWLNRAVPAAVPGVKRILTDLQHPDSPRREAIEAALQKVRDTTLQSRDRLDSLDELHELVLGSAFGQRDVAVVWWTRICMAYRSSLFCWPLLAEQGTTEQDGESGSSKTRLRGLSLPISLFVIEDGKSDWKPEPNPRGQKIWFKYKLSRKEESGRKEPRFRPPEGKLPAHINGYLFGFTADWWQAFNVGLDVAKKLWNSQNGRLRFADPVAAERKLKASLNVDLRAACDIVDAVLSKMSDKDWQGQNEETHFFTVSDRSAEAYWVQCVLSLMLPSGDLPMGVCTGTVSYRDNEYEIGVVEGVAAKLDYANRAGFPRAIVPGVSRDYYDADPFSDDEVDDDVEKKSDSDDAIVVSPANADPGTQPEVSILPEELTEEERIKRELKDFLGPLRLVSSRKTIEVNFALTARAAADAMQPAGWRRTDFLRTPEFQRMFSRTQRRLFMRDALRDRTMSRRLKRSDVMAYRENPWRSEEEQRLERLDRELQSRTGRTVKHITRETIRKIVPGMSLDEALGAWAAWKDNQVRSGTENGYRGPGLGVLTLRTAEGDTETRVWAALAEMLVADESWWERFQWADLPEAADLLARLLCNHRADPAICEESAPDLLFVFDDQGFATERTNQIFPSEFHHQFIDLLNPRLRSNNKFDYLDAALKKYSQSDRGLETRVIVVLSEDLPIAEAQFLDDVELSDIERKLLERLAIFRFGCSRHAGFAMANFDTGRDDQLDWPSYEAVLGELWRRRLIAVTRNVIYLTRIGRRLVGSGTLSDVPIRQALAHRHAAFSLCPILSPAGARIATNRDRQLEPENVLEATWHLEQALKLMPWRFRGLMTPQDGSPSVTDAQALLTFLRTMPDWDTVKRLRVNTATRAESVELCHELLKSQADVLQHEPPSLVVGLTIETMGRVFKNEVQRESSIEQKVTEIVGLVDTAMARLKEEHLSPTEWRRRLRHLLSRQLFALRMLGLPLNDPILAPARSYIDTAVTEILKPSFLEGLGAGREGLDDFPISQDCWRMLWSDGNRESIPNQTLTLMQRSRYAYAAARANLSKIRSDGSGRDSWDEPWIAYFTLTRPEDIEPRQITAPLNTWWSEYGVSEEASQAFGRRVLDMQPHAQKTKRGEWRERWLSELETATGNLWRYVVADEKAERLVGAPVAPALRLIRMLALQEVLPAWRFVKDAGPEWLQRWPVLAGTKPGPHWPPPANGSYGFVANEWSALARAVIGHKAGWIAMLASLQPLRDDKARLALVRSWLSVSRSVGITLLNGDDPEDLRRLGRALPTSSDFGLHSHFARKNADHVLNLPGGRAGLPLDSDERALLGGFVDHFSG
jgi:hypothetical protein